MAGASEQRGEPGASSAPAPPQELRKRRMLVVVNPYASTVSDRLRHLVVYALQGRYEVDAIDTEAKGHATELAEHAAREGYDVVVAFGGDGTVNEAANGLLGSQTPLSCLPGGSANVFGKMLGIPGDIVEATEHLLGLADDWRPRRVDLGVVNGRRFTFASGLGIDASVVARVDAKPRLKSRFGPWYFTAAAIASLHREYLFGAPQMVAEVDGRRVEGVTVVIQNGSPFTYFADRPIEIAEGPALDSGTFSSCVLKRATPAAMPLIAWRALSPRAKVVNHRQIEPFTGLTELVVRSNDDR
ncbi:MAG: diacylglycerol/lipid kinase family protein, partial [Solirubrobacteraceae bacterium]